ncbi:hypothetical protein NE237_022318 [Protea cynaroides]|uniref:Uncharacterized protein n=1 Tax=Protea cynaroides TaxID=273540 RepID=A0A9Q0HEV9_9MAGN|nr:hypothetical protein NE237_022318 [Protea cynaroides]
MTRTSLFDKLVKGEKLKILETRPVPNPLPHYWRPNEFCKYHNQSGHDTKYCTALRHAIQDLLDSGKFKLQPREASIANNPLPHHAVNFIEWGEVHSDKDILTKAVQFVNGRGATPGDEVSLVSIEEVGGEYEAYFPEIPQHTVAGTESKSRSLFTNRTMKRKTLIWLINLWKWT